ncbi:MAG: TetR/AcrR family transcriptional regulator [Gammaproteobacteria bacterium]|nr:TetR/AcrR family transcriptional regulator [Gammaproteobacteria bacterium]
MVDGLRKRLRPEERAEQFLLAAADIVRRDGTQALTMESLAAACGVNKALPYRHFSNRDAVLVALYKRQNDAFDLALAAEMQVARSFEDALRALVDTWSKQAASGAGLPALQEVRTSDGELETLRANRIQASVAYIAHMIGRYWDISKRDAILAASVLFAGSRGLTAIWDHTHAPRAALNESFIRMAIGAVKAVARPLP